MPGETKATVRFLDHLSLASLVGVTFGMVMFVLEPMWLLGGQEYTLGASPAALAAVFTAMGLVVGVIAGIVIGAVLPRLRPSWPVGTVIVLYITLFAYLTLALVLRSLMVFEIWYVTRRPPFYVAVASAPVFAILGFAAARALGSNAVRIRRAPLLALSAALVFAAQVWNLATIPKPQRHGIDDPDKPNVVLIVLDALRRDRLSCYGHERETSPHIDRLADEGVLFLRAYSHGPRTVYSMPSLFTSQYPAFHTMMHYQKRSHPLPRSRTTMSEMLHDAGYSTACVVTNPYLRSNFGTIQGYDIADQFGGQKYDLGFFWMLQTAGLIRKPYYADHRKPNATEVTDQAVTRVHQLAPGPFFLFVHYMDTHHAYLPPPPYQRMFLTNPDAPSPAEVYDLTRNFYIDRKVPEPSVLRALQDYYDACIRYADEEIGRLIDEIRKLHRGSVIIITADHGDEFLEHGYLYHTNIAYEELIHVPLIMSLPGGFGAGRRIDAMARHIDVLPTIADIVGVDPPATAMGRSLLPVIRGEEADSTVESYAQGPFNAALNTGQWKVIYNDTLNTFSLYDLSSDASETRDIWREHPEFHSELRERLEEYLKAAEAVEEHGADELDPDTVRRLKALGYL
jgi:arylsulfatase A-like enzyme